MRRNLGSEILIAIGGLGVIICGLLFALFLTSSNEPPSPTLISSSIVSETSVALSNTDDITATMVAQNVSSPTDTPEPTETSTDEPTNTPEPTATSTDEPTNTPEPTVTDAPTDTPEPTETATDAPTDTPEPTETATDEPTDTPTATSTDEPTDTPEPTATNTLRPTRTSIPTHTPTYTPQPMATATSTTISSFTGIIPTLPPSPTVIPLNEPTRTPASCQLPAGWATYVVQSGDTLFAISLVTNSTVDELRFANCIDDIDNITAGDTIYVPTAPIRPVPTFVPSGVRQGLAAVGCTSATTQITSPITAQRVRGSFTVFGTATRPDFQYYKIEVRPDFASIYNFYSDSQSQVDNGVLGQINAELFGPGLHWIRLSVVDIRAEIAPDAICEIPVIFE
ncbi:MAG: LysM peptidoglycan-binding domain-containing protein [Phototrophicaceae bacterium]